jgi:hypothetical protein
MLGAAPDDFEQPGSVTWYAMAGSRCRGPLTSQGKFDDRFAHLTYLTPQQRKVTRKAVIDRAHQFQWVGADR